MTTFQVTPGWLVYHPNPSTPRFKVPPGSVDAHCHVFGPGDRFPYAPERKYTPADASKEQLFALRDRLGFDKNVIVQATCHGTDNRALVERGIYASVLAPKRNTLEDLFLDLTEEPGIPTD